MSLKRVGSLLSLGGENTFGFADIDVAANDEIEYDVSRDRLIGRGLSTVRNEIYRSLIRGLQKQGLFELLDENFVASIELNRKNFTNSPPLDKDLLEKVRKLLPGDNWHVKYAEEIAEKLHQDTAIIYKYIIAAINIRKYNDPKKHMKNRRSL